MLVRINYDMYCYRRFSNVTVLLARVPVRIELKLEWSLLLCGLLNRRFATLGPKHFDVWWHSLQKHISLIDSVC